MYFVKNIPPIFNKISWSCWNLEEIFLYEEVAEVQRDDRCDGINAGRVSNFTIFFKNIISK